MNRLTTSFIVQFLIICFSVGCATPEGLIEEQSSDSQEPITALKSDAARTDLSTDSSPFDDQQNCIFDPSDEFEPRSTFQSGPWQGECHDTRSRRPVDFLNDEQAQRYQDPSNYLVINNVYHQNAFWIAFVPKNAIKNVYFQLEYFPAIIPAGHTQLRVQYKEPIILFGQSSSVEGLRDEIFDLTLSIEAVTRPNDQYDLIKGTQEHFAIAYRVTSMEARYESMIIRQGHHVEQWRLLLEEEEAEALLEQYVSESSIHQLNYSYHTLLKNCTTELIKILDTVATYSWREQVQRFLVKVTEIYPNVVRAALIARGLLPLDQSTDWYPLEEDEEFIEGYQAP